MFDFHMHSRVSFDSQEDPLKMACKARDMGLTAICFTEHLDYDPKAAIQSLPFDTADYNSSLEGLEVPGLQICLGMEFGMLPDNRQTLEKDLKRRPFDFVIGSIHFIEDVDAYFEEFWNGKTVEQGELASLEQTLSCVQAHDDFDVLGHLTYISKTQCNPVKRRVNMTDYQDLVDEIFKVLIAKGKGIEVNTSGVDVCGVTLPDIEYLLRFKELGGQIVTVGSDAHSAARVGQYCREAAKTVQEIFGAVCTFKDRNPIFHKI